MLKSKSRKSIITNTDYETRRSRALFFVRIVGLICLVAVLVIIGVALPIYLIWQGEWVGILGLLLYSILLLFGKVINNCIQ